MQNNQLRVPGLRICGLARQLVTGAIITLSLLVPADGLGAEEPPSAMALLRGVEVVRTQHDSLRTTLEIRYVSPPPAKTIECLVEMDGDRRRFEVFAGEVPGQVILRDGDEFHGFRRKKHEDVAVYDLRRATGVRGDVAFDPRILGLSDFMPCHLTAKNCLWYDSHDRLEVAGQESLRGVSVWRVKVNRKNSIAEFWIEEPSFRVHRKTVETPYIRIEIDSEFDSGASDWPFPSRVIAKRTYKQSDRSGLERIYTVKSFDFGADIPAERFTLKSMDLHVNTMINDYRINRIVGYWNGEGLSDNPVYNGERPSELSAPGSQGGRRLLVITLNLLFMVLLAAVIYWRRRRRMAP
jgi:hypothetical protein